MDLPTKHVRFTYTPLDFKNKEIRLVKIKQSSDLSSPIQIDMQNVDFAGHSNAINRYDEEVARLDEEGLRFRGQRARDMHASFLRGTSFKFTALSYTWGPELPAQDILVTSPESRGWLSVRQNLYEFLKIRRDSVLVRPNRDDKLQPSQDLGSTSFWIDQICINQGKNDEKAHQVHQMAEIYSAAYVVEAWLGSGFEGSNELVDLIIDQEGALFYDHPLSLRSVSERERDEREMRRFGPSLHQFVRLPYWSRLWVTQEIVLGRVVYLRIGSKTLSWDYTFYPSWQRLERGWNRLRDTDRYKDRETREGKILSRIHEIDSNRRVRDTHKSWHSVTTLVRGTECKDPRDRVFGAMGMLRPSLRMFPDYSMHLQDILLELLTKEVNDLYAADLHAANVCTSGHQNTRRSAYRDEFSWDIRRQCLTTAVDWLTHLEDDENSINPNSVRRHILKIVPLGPLEAQRIFGRAWRLKYWIWKTIPSVRTRLERSMIFDPSDPALPLQSESWKQANDGLLQLHNDTSKRTNEEVN